MGRYLDLAKQSIKSNVDIKREYNQILEREQKAEVYFDRQEIPQEEKEKHIPEYKKILYQLNNLLKVISRYAKDEILHGFKI